VSAAPVVAPRPRPRGWVATCAGLALTFLALAIIGHLARGQPGGPASSSYATGETGVAAWAELLSRSGRAVQRLRTPLADARLPGDETLILLEPDALLPGDARRLRGFLRDGGRLIYGSSDPQSTLPALLPSPPSWHAQAADRYLATAGHSGAARDVAVVQSAGQGAWDTTTGFRAPLESADGQALVLERPQGKGTLTLLADVSPLQDRLLSKQDNAQLALNLAGPAHRPVVFVESVHGYGERRGLAALPSGWRVAFIGLALAGLLWLLARGRRLGPAEQTASPTAPERGEYADALALLLRRTEDEEAVERAIEREGAT
jgi:hypothetical protein